MAGRPNLLREKLLQGLWQRTLPAGIPFFVSQQLGEIPRLPGLDNTDEFVVSASKSMRRRADLILLRGGAIEVIEFKIRDDGSALGQLVIYRDLVPETPELAMLRGRPVTLRLVQAVQDAVIARAAERLGIIVEIFTPPEIVGFLTTTERERISQFVEGGASISLRTNVR